MFSPNDINETGSIIDKIGVVLLLVEELDGNDNADACSLSTTLE